MRGRRQARRLPEDLLLEILCRLPVKSLLRFRCVSKPWLALVDDDADFARLHLDTLKNNRDQTRLFVVESMQETSCAVRCADTFEFVSQIPSMLQFEGFKWSIVSYLDGLVLLKVDGVLQEANFLQLWNPSLGRRYLVPPIGLRMRSLVIGLGYDPLAKDYKIVTLVYDFLTELPSKGIYSVGAGSWKKISFRSKRLSRFGKKFLINGNVYLQGSLYFLLKGDGDILLSFDMSNEVFSGISMPDDINASLAMNLELVLVDGGSSLAMYRYDDDNSIWVLETETMNWTERRWWGNGNRCTKLLYCNKNGDMFASRLNMNMNIWEVASYSAEKHEYKILQQQLIPFSFWSLLPNWSLLISTYVESLILNNLGKAVRDKDLFVIRT